MPKRNRSKIEKEADAEFEAKSKEELAAEFDQSHALHVPAQKRESKLISIRLPMAMIIELREVAQKRGDVGYQQLIKIFIAEGLLRSQNGISNRINRLSASKSRMAKATIPYPLLLQLLKILGELQQVSQR